MGSSKAAIKRPDKYFNTFLIQSSQKRKICELIIPLERENVKSEEKGAKTTATSMVAVVHFFLSFGQLDYDVGIVNKEDGISILINSVYNIGDGDINIAAVLGQGVSVM